MAEHHKHVGGGQKQERGKKTQQGKERHSSIDALDATHRQIDANGVFGSKRQARLRREPDAIYAPPALAEDRVKQGGGLRIREFIKAEVDTFEQRRAVAVRKVIRRERLQQSSNRIPVQYELLQVWQPQNGAVQGASEVVAAQVNFDDDTSRDICRRARHNATRALRGGSLNRWQVLMLDTTITLEVGVVNWTARDAMPCIDARLAGEPAVGVQPLIATCGEEELDERVYKGFRRE